MGSFGGGILTSLSSNVLGNSDFYTSAFPAEYNNAISGIFDMRLRNGNDQRFQHTFQLGILGIDAASEGPLGKRGKASYIFNYRYSTVELLSKLSKSKDMSQSLNYQDLNFKLNFPTAHAGTFSFWTTALIDKVGPQMRKPSDWEYAEDAKDSRAKQTSAAAGLSHHYLWNNGGMLKTTLALLGNQRLGRCVRCSDECQARYRLQGALHQRGAQLVFQQEIQLAPYQQNRCHNYQYALRHAF